jgi:hypothetical protein
MKNELANSPIDFTTFCAAWDLKLLNKQNWCIVQPNQPLLLLVPFTRENCKGFQFFK